MSQDADRALAAAVTLDNCAREPIHIPGAIQPHGVLLVCREKTLEIEQVSASIEAWLGRTPASVLGKPLPTLFASNEAEPLVDAASAPSLRERNPLRLNTPDGRAFEATLHRPPNREGAIVVELEQVPAAMHRGIGTFDPRLRTAIVRLQNATDVDSLRRIAVEQVRELTGFDRVMLYAFDADWNGEVVAEAKHEELDSFFGQHYPASDIPAQARRLYELNWLRLIADVSYTPSPMIAMTPGPPLDMSFAVLRSVSPIHIEYLKNMGVRASMSVSLLKDGKLTGLIACHHYRGPNLVSYTVRETVEYLGQALSWHGNVLRTAADAEHAKNVQEYEAEVVRSMAIHGELLEGLGIDALVPLAGAKGAAVVLADGLRRLGATPDPDRIAVLIEFLRTLDSDVFVTEKISEHIPEATAWEETAAGVLAVAISRPLGEFLLWFRPSTERVIDWGGNPNHVKLTQVEGEAPRLTPRGSFALWREIVRGRSSPWQPWEIEGASKLRHVLLGGVRRRAAELRAANETLIDADRAKDHFITTVSHELRTPLNAITGWTQVLRRGGISVEKTAHALDVITRNVQTQAQLVEDLLDVSRISTGKLTLDVESVDLPTLIQNAVENAALALEAKSITLTPILDADATPILGDPIRLQQVVSNLLNNAVKFTPQGGSITVTLRRLDSEVELSVADSGQGIAADFLPHVFDAFRQQDGGMNRRSQGLGLGLAIVRRLVELHGGHASVESKGEGQGATFFVRLPKAPLRIMLDPAPPHETALPAPAVVPTELRGMRVLIVEDEVDARELMDFVLTQRGAEVTTASDAASALVALDQATAIDVVVSDVGLPDIDGFELMRRVRARPPEKHGRVPAVALTAYTRAVDRTRALQAGFQSHVPKPVDPEELIVVLLSLVHRD